MKKFCVCVLLLIFARPGFANPPVDYLLRLAAIHNFFPNPVIEYGSDKDGSGFFFNPACLNQPQAPQVDELNDFFESHAETPLLDHNSRYLPRHESKFGEQENLPATTRHLNAIATDFNAAANGQSTVRSAPVFFEDANTASSTCQAKGIRLIEYADA